MEEAAAATDEAVMAASSAEEAAAGTVWAALSAKVEVAQGSLEEEAVAT